MIFNCKKTVCMHILPKWLKNFNVPNMYLNGAQLTWVHEQKYLGIIMTSTFTDNKDIIRQVRATYARGNALICKFRKCTDNVKVQLFKSFCSNFYCSSLWFNFTNATFNRLKVAYNNVFRSLMNISRRSSISAAFVNFGVNCFNTLIRKCITSLRQRVLCSDNVLIMSCLSCKFNSYISNMSKQWNSLILWFF